MSLWWMWGGGTAIAGTPETNAPSLWDAGVRWASTTVPYKAYWQTIDEATPRTGTPDIAIAADSELITSTVHTASWSLGQQDWLGTLSPSSASFDVEGEVDFAPMDVVVISVLSTVSTEHSDPLWVGYVDTIEATHETSGRITTSVSCVNVVGRLGQANVPDTFPALSFPNSGLADYLEEVARQSGAAIVVVDEGGRADDSPSDLSFGDSEQVLDWFNQVSQYDNFNLFARGDGSLYLVRRYYQEAPDLDPAPTPVELTGSDLPTSWRVQLSPTSVVNDFPGFTETASMLASQDTYGKRSYPLSVPAEPVLLPDSGVMETPRPLLTSADFPVTDLGDAVLFIDPADWVTLDGETYQVLTVSHSVQPGHEWRVELTGDTTQVVLHEAYE